MLSVDDRDSHDHNDNVIRWTPFSNTIIMHREMLHLYKYNSVFLVSKYKSIIIFSVYKFLWFQGEIMVQEISFLKLTFGSSSSDLN